MTLSRHGFAEVTTLSQELIFARIAENNRGGIFSKFLLDAGCNLPKSQKKPFLKKCGLRPFVSSQSIYFASSMWIHDFIKTLFANVTTLS